MTTTSNKGTTYGYAAGESGWTDTMNENLRRLDAYAPDEWAQEEDTTTGLTYGYRAGGAWSGSAYSRVSAGTVALTNNTTNYVERTAAGVVSANTSGFTATKLPMAKVTTSGGAITDVEDWRAGAVLEPAGTVNGSTVPASPTIGQMLYASASAVLSWLAGNTTTTRKFLRSTGTGAAAQAPAWDTLQSGDLGLTTRGDLVTKDNTTTPERIAIGTSGQVLTVTDVGSGNLEPRWADVTGTGAAPSGAQYLTLATNASLSAERVLVPNTNDFSATDGGANGNYDLALTNSRKTCSIVAQFGDGQTAPTVNALCAVRVPFACTILRWTIWADASGSAVVDVLKTTYASLSFSSIAASAKPTLSSAQKNEDTTLTGWTTSVSADDLIQFKLTSLTTCKSVTVELEVRRT